MPARVIAVLGGTGRVGREVVRQALTAGHIINVVSRSRERAMALPQPITFVDGDATWPAVIDRAVGPADVVISALGHAKDSPDDVLTQAMTHTLAAMERHGVRRIVILACTEAGGATGSPSSLRRLLGALVRSGSGRARKDHSDQVRLITDSDVDWTVVSAPSIVDRAPTGSYRVSSVDAPSGSDIARADLARLLLDCAMDIPERLVHQTVFVSQSGRG